MKKDFSSKNVIIGMLKNFKLNSVFIRMLLITFSVFLVLCLINFASIRVLRQQALENEASNSEFYVDYSYSYMQKLISKLDEYLYSLAYDSNVVFIRNLPQGTQYALNYVEVKDIFSKLSIFKVQIDEIENVYIYFPNIDRIFTADGEYEPYTYFKLHYSGDYDEWKRLLAVRYTHVFNIWDIGTSPGNPSQVNLINSVYGSAGTKSIIVANTNRDLVKSLFQDNEFASKRKIYITNRDLQVISSNTDSETSLKLSLNPQQLNESGGSYYDSKYLVSYRYLPEEKIYFVVMTPRDVIFSNVNRLTYAAYMFLAVMLLAGLVLSVFLSQQFYMPIGQMLKDMELFAAASISLQGRQNEYEYIKSNLSALYTSNRKLEGMLRGGIPIVTDIIIMKLLLGGQEVENAALLMRQYGIEFKAGHYIAAVFRCAHAFEPAAQKAISDWAAAADPATPENVISVLKTGGEEIVIIFHGESAEAEGRVLKQLEQISGQLTEQFENEAIYCGLGGAEETMMSIHSSYRSAKKALEERGVQDGSRAYGYSRGGNGGKRESKAQLPAGFEERYMNAIHAGNLDLSESILDDILDHNYMKNLTFLAYHRLCVWLYDITGRIIDNASGGAAGNLSREMLEEVDTAGDVNELNDRVLRNNRLLCSAFSNERKSDSSFVKILKYIDDNFTTNINLDAVAIVLGYNPSYLSRLFKQYMGIGFSDYLTKMRLEYAKKLLGGPARMVKEIAEDCGYNNTGIFIRAFEKQEGITPGEYQKKAAKAR